MHGANATGKKALCQIIKWNSNEIVKMQLSYNPLRHFYKKMNRIHKIHQHNIEDVPSIAYKIEQVSHSYFDYIRL